MRTMALINGLILALTIGMAQQKKPTPPQESPAGLNKPASAQPAPKNAQPKVGSLTVKGEGIKFFSRGEGTLTIKGHGFVLVNDLQGEVVAQGFRELKQLPRGVTLNPPMDKRIRVLHGKGTLTIKGKYDSVRCALTEAHIDFRGGASFEIMGTGTGKVDGKHDIVIYPTAAFTLFVPEPEGMKQPPPNEPEIAPLPKGKAPQPKTSEQKPVKKEGAKGKVTK